MPTPLTDADKVLRNDTGKDIVTVLSKMSTLTTKQIINTPIATFTDGADNVPVKSLVSEIVATGGGGTPDAPIAISGFDNAIITRCGKNLYDISNQTKTESNTYNNMYLPTNTDITFSVDISQRGLYVGYYDNGNWVGLRQAYNTTSLTFNTGNHNYFRLMTYNVGEQATEFQAELGTTATAYEPYIGNTYTIPFGQTVYGGRLNVTTGELRVTHKVIDLGTLNFSQGFSGFYTLGIKDEVEIPSTVTDSQLVSSIYSVGNTTNADQMYIQFNASYLGWVVFLPSTSYATASDFKTAMNGIPLVYKLATPITVQLTPTEVKTLLGENNIFSNCGDINTLVYYPQGQDAVVSLNSIANGVLGITDVLTEGLDNIAEAVVPRAATEIPIQSGSATNTKDYIDSVVESGSNTNGYYVKYKDGTMICTKVQSRGVAVADWNAWGSCYDSEILDLGSWANTFYSTPVVNVNSSGAGAWIENVWDMSTTACGKLRLVRPSIPGGGITINFQIIGVGRWKA